MDFNKPYPTGGSDPAHGMPQEAQTPRREAEVRLSDGPGVEPNESLYGSDEQEEFREEARQAGDRMKESARSIKDSAQAMADQATGKARAAGQRMRELGSTAILEQKRRAADEVGIVSSAIRRAADKLHQEKDHNLGEYAEAAAEQLDRAERYLRDQPVDRMYEDLQQFARRRPEMLVGGMFIAGVALARFLKASRPASDTSSARTLLQGDSHRVAAGPLVTPSGQLVTPSLYPPPQAAEDHRIVVTEHIPEVK